MGLPAPGPGHNSSWLWKTRLTAIIQFLILFNAVLTCKNKCFITEKDIFSKTILHFYPEIVPRGAGTDKKLIIMNP